MKRRNLLIASIVIAVAIVSISWFIRDVKAQIKSSSSHSGHQQLPKKTARPADQILGPDGASSDYPTPVFSASGQLWLAFVEGDAVYVTHSADDGKTFVRATRVNREPESIDANGEGRPKIALGKAGQVYVTWTRRMAKAYTGELRFSVSTDNGRTFSTPRALANEPAGQRFDTLAVDPEGKVIVAWVDKRDLEKSKSANIAYPGAALYYAKSDDNGVSFKTIRKIKDNICECCRLVIDFDPAGNPVLLWRDVIPESIRDHSLARLDKNGGAKIMRVSFDDWKLDGCPHHGPSLSVAPSGRIHFAWFTGEGKNGPGVFYANTKDGQVSNARRFGNAGFSGRPAVLAAGKKVFLVWKEEQSNGAEIHSAVSKNDGLNWTALPVVASTKATSDHPILIKKGDEVFLSWFTKNEGYRLIPVH